MVVCQLESIRDVTFVEYGSAPTRKESPWTHSFSVRFRPGCDRRLTHLPRPNVWDVVRQASIAFNRKSFELRIPPGEWSATLNLSSDHGAKSLVSRAQLIGKELDKPRYSYLNATTGSTRVARRAGT